MLRWRNNIPTWLSFIIFQCGWLLIVAGHHRNLFWLIIPAIIIYLLVEAYKQNIATQIYVGRLFIILLGFSVDMGLAQLELIQFTDSADTLPIWLFLLWCWFALNFSDSFSWLKNRHYFAVSLGALFGPLAYFGASKMSEVIISSPIYFSLASGVFWGALFFLIFNDKKLKKFFLK